MVTDPWFGAYAERYVVDGFDLDFLGVAVGALEAPEVLQVALDSAQLEPVVAAVVVGELDDMRWLLVVYRLEKKRKLDLAL